MEAILLPGLAPSSYSEVKDFIHYSPFAIKRFQEASDVIGYSLIDAFKEAGDRDYEVYESAFLANSIALLDHFKEKYGIEPNVAIGPSFGVLGAAVYTKSLTYEESMWLTHESGKVSKDFYINLEGDFQTHFIYNLSLDEANEYIQSFKSEGKYLELAGYLEKVVCLCGPKVVIDELKEKLNHKPKCFSLHTMNQPIHSGQLRDLNVKLSESVFKQVDFKPIHGTFISDVNGALITDPDEFKQTILDGYDNPVRWDLVKERIQQLGLEKVYVIGPKNLFSQLLKNQIQTIDLGPDNVLMSGAVK